jgi:hypothetical protein
MFKVHLERALLVGGKEGLWLEHGAGYVYEIALIVNNSES